MALYVNTNVSSINARRNLDNSTRKLDTAYERLASGLRINSAKDDAAGLQIANRLTSQVNGLEQDNRNAQDGISYAQTAEGAMDEITSMLQRIRTLAIQSANGTNSAKDRQAIQQEVLELCCEIDRIAADTTFGGEKILNGEKTYTNTLDSTAGTTNGTDKNISFQVGADAKQTIDIDLNSEGESGFDMCGMCVALGFTDANISDDGTQAFVINGKSVSFDVSTAVSSQSVLANIDKFITLVDKKRAELGAVQNRLESTIRNQSNIHENVSDARSRIRDTDFAVETANLTEQSIIQQASQNILTQANQRPQMALNLLGN
jgi:flagellin